MQVEKLKGEIKVEKFNHLKTELRWTEKIKGQSSILVETSEDTRATFAAGENILMVEEELRWVWKQAGNKVPPVDKIDYLEIIIWDDPSAGYERLGEGCVEAVHIGLPRDTFMGIIENKDENE